jgi:hypothetical protein
MAKEEILLSDSFEIFLKFLYGSRYYHQIGGYKSKSEWKKVILKIINSIEKSIRLTIENTDSAHKTNLINKCQYIRDKLSKARNLNEINEKTILGLFRLVFLLIGDEPNNWEFDKPYHSNHWTLNKKRQVVYIQTAKQKAELILKKASKYDDLKEDSFNYHSLHNKLFYDLNGDYQRFIDWIKKNYTEKYLEII